MQQDFEKFALYAISVFKTVLMIVGGVSLVYMFVVVAC